MATLPENPNMETLFQKDAKQGREPHIKNVINLLNQNTYQHRMHDVFRDFVAMAAITLSNAVDKVHYEEREAEYMKIVKKYTKDEAYRFSEAFAELVMAFDCGFDDVLGRIYMQLELGNDHKGQFFTPYHMCQLMAKMAGPTKDEIDHKLNHRGFIEASDPCVGAGAMIVALAEEMYLSGINYQQCLHVSATDIDITAVHMAYIQFTMYHIPAVITWGNTLTLETWGHWYTLAHCMGKWSDRLQATNAVEHMIDFFKQTSTASMDEQVIDMALEEIELGQQQPESTEPVQPIVVGEQITLF